MNIEVSKQTIFEALEAIEGLTVYNLRPKVDMALPCVLFTLTDMGVDVNLDKDVANQTEQYTLDIFGKTSTITSNYLVSIEAVMRNLGYVLEFALDVPDPDNISHINTRFNIN